MGQSPEALRLARTVADWYRQTVCLRRLLVDLTSLADAEECVRPDGSLSVRVPASAWRTAIREAAAPPPPPLTVPDPTTAP